MEDREMGTMKPDAEEVWLVNNRKEFKIYSKYFLRETIDILKQKMARSSLCF